jgi:hypothetical protein
MHGTWGSPERNFIGLAMALEKAEYRITLENALVR